MAHAVLAALLSPSCCECGRSASQTPAQSFGKTPSGASAAAALAIHVSIESLRLKKTSKVIESDLYISLWLRGGYKHMIFPPLSLVKAVGDLRLLSPAQNPINTPGEFLLYRDEQEH